MINQGTQISRRFSVAPMMDWTDRHDRFFLRLLSKRALLYTEMVTADAAIHGDQERLLGFSEEEHPVALQLGGSDPAKLAKAAKIGADFGYDEINLNVGCPSDRVQSGSFGACLMKEPELVAACWSAMAEAVDIPVTVKSRIGVDDDKPRERLPHFIETVKAAGCETFIVHARKALLQGLSPKENREVPPLDYGLVYEMKQTYPDLEIIINGGIETLDEADAHIDFVDGVMLGRAAYHTPYILADVDRRFFGKEGVLLSEAQAVEALYPYMEEHLSSGGRLHHITRHILGLFAGQPGARSWRRHLSEQGPKDNAGLDIVQEALQFVTENKTDSVTDAA